MRPRSLVAPWAALCLACPFAARAADFTDADLAHQPGRGGFFARGLMGMAYLRQTSALQTTQGTGAAVALQLGWMVDRDVGFFGDLTRVGVTGPRFEPNGVFSDDDPSVEASMTGLGGGVLWYPGPDNLSLSLSVQAATADQTRVSDDGEAVARYTGGWGFGSTLILAREWAMDEEWSVGGAALASFARLPDRGQKGPVNHDGAFGLALSARFR